jgi:hypothetical protein
MTRRLLAPLKPVLVPAWNGSHRAGRWLGERLEAFTHGRRERCVVCGRRAWMLNQPRAIPARLVELWGLSSRLAAALARKETLACSRCGAKLRCRRLAVVLLELFPTGEPPAPGSSVAAWVVTRRARALAIAEFNRVDGLHQQLAKLPGLHYSEFLDGVDPGREFEGVRCEDLTRLTYRDGRFDVVLSSETLEHVPDLERALREIHRVLVPGGVHIFTIPRLPGIAHTFSRARLAANGSIEPLVSPLLHHPGGDVGYPVFTEFGADAGRLFEAAGFETAERFGPVTDDDLAQVWVCRRGT